MMFSVIFLSGGKGKRMGKSLPKQYLLLAGKPIIMHSLERLDGLEEVNEIVVVCGKEYVDYIRLMAEQYNITTPLIFADAGITRQSSVYSGLQKVSNENVIIHEAARPFVKIEDFKNLINDSAVNATLGYPISFTVVQGRDTISGVLDRNLLVNVQLPQKFKTSILKKAHEFAKKENRLYTEDAGMVYECMDVPIKIINGTAQNIKITEPIDIVVGEIIYEEHIKGRR